MKKLFVDLYNIKENGDLFLSNKLIDNMIENINDVIRIDNNVLDIKKLLSIKSIQKVDGGILIEEILWKNCKVN